MQTEILILENGLVGHAHFHQKFLKDFPEANLFSLDREYRYTFFTTAYAKVVRDLWGVELSLGMNALTEVMSGNHDRTKASNCFSWAMSNHEFTVTEAYGTSSARRLFLSCYRPILDEKGAVDGITVSMTDITARTQLASERHALDQKLVESSHLTSLGLMVGCVSHDFNNVLLPVLLNSELALKLLEETHPAGELLREIVASARCAGDLTKQLLTFGAVGGLAKKVVDLNEVVEAASVLTRVAVGRRASFSKSVEPTPLRINANQSQLLQVIVNLLSNASESAASAAGERLQVTVETSSMNVSSSIQAMRVFSSKPISGKYAVLAVHDNGCGMSSELLDNIFQPFFTTKGIGRGLGLSAIKKIVSEHFGFLAIDSTPGVGSTFRIGFPIAQPTEPNYVVENPTEYSLDSLAVQPLRLLIIDENASSLDAISSVCRQQGHFVAMADCEKAGVTAIKSKQFDLVLLDGDMAVNGSDRILNSVPDDLKTPFVLMSAEAKGASLINHPNVHSLLPKPFSTAELVSTLQRVCPPRT